MILDPHDKKPDNWNIENKGEWRQRKIVNPQYIAVKRQIESNMKNPSYKGEWKPKMITNPNYKKVENLG